MNLAHDVVGPAGAPALVLLNSVGSDRGMWDPCIGPLAEQFRVIRTDARGHGRSPVAPGATTSLADLGADVLDVLDRLGLERVHVAGLSLGGMTAMWLAVHHPERIDRLALLCTSARLGPAQGWLDRAAAVRRDGMTSVAGTVVSRWITPALADRDPALRDRLRDMLAGTDAESYAQCCEAIAAMDLVPDLPRIAAPTVVIGGAQDPATPLEHQRVIAEGIVGSRLEVLDPAAHVATVEAPGAVVGVLLDHLRAGRTLAAGAVSRRAALGDAHVDASVAATTAFTAPFQEFITRYAWGDVWTRPGLARRDRSVATLAALVALGAEHEIGMHVSAARRHGLTGAEISEVLLHVALYAGLPRANRAFAIARDVLAAESPGEDAPTTT